MRTTSPRDIDFLSEHLGIKQIKESQDLAKLERKKGEGYLAGEWAEDGYEKIKVSPLRVMARPEGNFEIDEWLS